MKNKTKKIAELLKVLSVDTRLQIILHLKSGVLCVNALAARLDVTQGAVSQHLRIMRAAGLVSAEKRGYYVHYRLNSKTLENLLADAEKLFEEYPGAGEHKCIKKCIKDKEVKH
jgi:DNA-binding transcriptional ArsR family regulator